MAGSAVATLILARAPLVTAGLFQVDNEGRCRAIPGAADQRRHGIDGSAGKRVNPRHGRAGRSEPGAPSIEVLSHLREAGDLHPVLPRPDVQRRAG